MDLEQFKKDIIPLQRKLFAFALKMVENETEAEDIVQETFLKLWNIRGQLGTVTNSAAFAMQITKNACIDTVRKRKSTVEADDFHVGINDDNPGSDVEKADSILLIRKIIENLPELQKHIIRMRDIEDYELYEIAEITGTQVSAVTVNLSRARKKVREQYTRIMNYKL
jgi:RNA polymerase sigma-70 factor (ECF subfamily)